MVKNNHIYHQTWGVLVTHMYFPIEVSFSLPIGSEDEEIEIGHELATAKAHELLEGCIDTTIAEGQLGNFQYTFDLDLEEEPNVGS